MKIRYLLKKKLGPSGFQVFIALYDGDTTELIYTGERTNGKSEWSFTEGQPKDQTSDLFARIERVKAQVQKSMKLLEAQDLPVTPYTVKNAFIRAQKQSKETQKVVDATDKLDAQSVYSLAKGYKEDLPSKFRESTRRTLKISIDQFMQYLDKSGNRGLSKKDLNQEILVAYSSYLLDKRKLSDSTHNKRLKHLNWFLRTISVNNSIPPRKVRRKAIVALTLLELHALETVDVSRHEDKESHKYLQRAKDMFLLGCYTALRISDLKRLNPTNTSGGFITLTTQKNNQIFRMPLISQAREILSRYKGCPPRISEQEVNRSIKKVCEFAGIDSQIEVEGSKGGRLYSESVPKYSQITSHIAGKTFITNAKELWGLEPAEVAAMVGKDLKTMLNHYFKAPVESATIKMINADRALMKIA